MADKPAIMMQIVVDDTNKHLDFHYDGTDYNATIATGTYSDINALLTAVDTAMDSEAGTSVTLSTSIAVSSDIALVTFSEGDTSAFQLMWSTGTNASTSIGSDLGFDTSADDTGALEYTADYQPPSVWVSHRPPETDSYDQPKHIGSELVTSLDGTTSTAISVDHHHERRIKFPVMEPEVVYADQATGSDANRDFETKWETLIGGESFRYCEDRDTLSTYDTYYLIDPREWMGVVQRVGDGVRRHDFEILMRLQES
jgi:hypothetical protein